MTDAENRTLLVKLNNELADRDAEIARLKAELARIRGLPRLSQLDDENKKLRAKLRTALAQARTDLRYLPCREGTSKARSIAEAVSRIDVALANEQEGK